MTQATQLISKFAANLQFSDLPSPIQDSLIHFALDYFRVASIGERMEWSQWGRSYAQGTAGKGSSPVLFSDTRYDPVSTTFLNTLYAGSLDADDVHVGAMLHPGCIMFSTGLAIGQARHQSGADVLAAIAAGYEAMIRLAICIQPSHFGRGFQSTSTIGVLGAAVTAAKLIFPGPAAEKSIAASLGIAASFAGGLTQFYHSGSTVKRLHAAQAASSGTKAALLVESGFTGPHDIFEGKDGFARAYADAVDFSLLEHDLGEKFRIAEVAIKPHACSARVLSAIEAGTEIRSQYPFDVSEIESIYLGIPKVIQGRLTTNHPADLQAAQMSAPFAIALSLLPKSSNSTFSFGIDDFVMGLQDPKVMHLTQLVRCELDKEVEKTSSEESVSAKVIVTLRNGQQLSAFVISPKGSIARPFSLQDHIARAESELSSRLPNEKLSQFIEAVISLPTMPDVAVLSDLLKN
jgi:2-methylcitrate dehydratase PrpD